MSSVGSDNVVPLKRPGAQPTARGGTNRALKTSLRAATTPTGRAAAEATILAFPRRSSTVISPETVATGTARKTPLPPQPPCSPTSPLQAAVERGAFVLITDAVGDVLAVLGTSIAALSMHDFHFF